MRVGFRSIESYEAIVTSCVCFTGHEVILEHCDIDLCLFFNDIKSYGVLGKSCVRFAMYQAITKSLQYRAFVLLGGKSHEFLRISCVHFAMYEVIRSLRSHRNVVCVLQGRKSYEVIVMSCVLQGRKSYEVIAMS